MALQALIFDVDGTLAETEEMHRQAFNQAFVSLGLAWNWPPPLYKDLLRIAGGKERILHYLVNHLTTRRPQDLAAFEREIPRIYALKTKLYSAMVREGTLRPRPGVARLIAEASNAGIRLAIATTTNPANVDALLQSALAPSGEALFGVIVAGDEVAAKKPAPDVFDVAVRRLGFPASACIAFEDSANGVLAARRAGLAVVATPSVYTSDDDFAGAASVVSTLGEPGKPHQHLAGWKWPGGFVTVAGLQERAAEVAHSRDFHI
ncbi:MAG: HAD-IA family hydrolase [Candidatus Acidiferrales bacterium]